MRLKKFAYILAFLGVLTSVGGVASCKKDGDTTVVEQNTIRLNISAVSLDRYEVSKLKATVTGNDATVEWTSSNPAVLIVDENGNIYPQGEGDAVVTASVDGASATCNVSVTDLGEVPLLRAGFEETQILVGMTKNLDLTITYKGEQYAVTDYTLTSYGDAVTVENGAIKGASVGTSEVQIVGNWRGFQDFVTVSVSVIDGTLFYFEEPSVMVYTEAEFKGNSFAKTKRLEPVVLVGGEEKTATFTYESKDSSVATVDSEGVITGVGFGTTTVEGKATIDGREYTAVANVRVSYPEADDTRVYYLEKSQNNIIDFHAFNEEIVAVMDMDYNTIEATIEDNVVTMPQKDYLYLGTDEYKLVTAEEHVYNVKVNNVTYAISTAEELWNFRTVALEYSLEGYYVLDADIDFGYAKDWTRWNGYYPADSSAIERKAFGGTFDGNGHTIDSIAFVSGENMISSVGFIGALGDTGVMKNVAFTNVIFDGAKGTASGLIGECYGIVSDVYVHVKEFRNDEGDGKIAVFSDWIGTTNPKLSNIILDLSQAEMRGSKVKGTIYVGAAVTAANGVRVIGNVVNEWSVENHAGKSAHIYEDVNEFVSANVNGSFTKGWDTKIWDLSGDYPVFNTASVPVSIGKINCNLTETEDYTFTFKKGTITSFVVGETEITDFTQEGEIVTIPNATVQSLGYGVKKTTISTADATYISSVKTYTVTVNGVTEYSSRIIANESGATLSVNSDGYTVYTASNGAWDTRRVKVLNSYQAGQYVAIRAYSSDTALSLGGGGHANFWGGFGIGIYDGETKAPVVNATAGNWYLLVWKINEDIASVGGFSGTLAFLNAYKDGACVGKTVLIDKTYVFDDETAFVDWMDGKVEVTNDVLAEFNLSDTENYSFAWTKGTITTLNIGGVEIADFTQDSEKVTLPNATVQMLGYGERAVIATVDGVATYLAVVKTYTEGIDGVTQYSARALANESGATLSIDSNGCAVYTADMKIWSERRIKLLDSYTAGQYVAMEVYSDSAQLNEHMYFYGATRVGIYDRATKLPVSDTDVVMGKWYIFVWKINEDIASVGGYSGTMMFLDTQKIATLAGKTVLIDKSYVFDNQEIFTDWIGVVEEIEGTLAEFNLSVLQNYGFAWDKGEISMMTVGGVAITDFTQESENVTISNATVQTLGYGEKTVIIKVGAVTYVAKIKIYAEAVNGVIQYAPSAIVNDSGSTLATDSDGYTVYYGNTSDWSTRRVKIGGVDSYSAGQYVAIEACCDGLNIAHDEAAGSYFWGATKIATYDKSTLQKVTTGEKSKWYILVYKIDADIASVGGFSGTFTFVQGTPTQVKINKSYVFDDETAFDTWLQAQEPEVPEVPENPNYEQYGPSAVQYEGGDNAFSTDANTGYTVYTALATSWDSRRGKLLDSYTAGQYVAIEVYSDYALMHTHMYFYGATLKGVYDKETKQIVEASAMQKGKWYILVWEINADIASVGGYSGTFMFLDLNQDGTLAGKTVLINNAYVFDDKTAFDSWVTA